MADVDMQDGSAALMVALFLVYQELRSPVCPRCLLGGHCLAARQDLHGGGQEQRNSSLLGGQVRHPREEGSLCPTAGRFPDAVQKARAFATCDSITFLQGQQPTDPSAIETMPEFQGRPGMTVLSSYILIMFRAMLQ